MSHAFNGSGDTLHLSEFREVDARLGRMHGYGTISDACRANRHEDCADPACACACHAGEDE